jgi:hypothetical protein
VNLCLREAPLTRRRTARAIDYGKLYLVGAVLCRPASLSYAEGEQNLMESDESIDEVTEPWSSKFCSIVTNTIEMERLRTKGWAATGHPSPHPDSRFADCSTER